MSALAARGIRKRFGGVNPSSGQHEGRFAFFDTAIEGRWGGLISGDRVIADFDTPNVTIVAGSVARYSDLRGAKMTASRVRERSTPSSVV